MTSDAIMMENCDETKDGGDDDEDAAAAVVSRKALDDSKPQISWAAERAGRCDVDDASPPSSWMRFTTMFFLNSTKASLSPSVMTTESAQSRWARTPFRPRPAPSYKSRNTMVKF